MLLEDAATSRFLQRLDLRTGVLLINLGSAKFHCHSGDAGDVFRDGFYGIAIQVKDYEGFIDDDPTFSFLDFVPGGQRTL